MQLSLASDHGWRRALSGARAATRLAASNKLAALVVVGSMLASCAPDETAQTGVVEPLLIIATRPAQAGSAVSPDARISVTFSDDVDAATLSNDSFWLESSDGARLQADVAYDAESRTATLTPAAPLAYSAGYTFGLTNAIRSTDGVELGNDGTFSFETVDPPPLKLLSVTPSNGATDIPRASALTFVFSEAVDPSSVTDTSLTVTDTNAGGGAVSGSRQVEGAVVTFTPDTELAYSSELEIRLGASIASARATQDGGQLAAAPITTTARVVDPPPLFVTASQPPNGSTDAAVNAPIAIIFSQPLAPASISADADGTVALAAGAAQIPVSAEVPEADPHVLLVTPDDPEAFGDNLLAFATELTLSLGSAIRSVAADPNRSPEGTLQEEVSITFTTVPPPPLQLLLASPADGAARVSLDEAFVLVFSEPLDASTFDGAVTLNQGTPQALGPDVGGLSPSFEGATVRLSHASLATESTYTLSLTSDLTSERGGALVTPEGGPHTITFDTIPFEPLRLETTPANGSIGAATERDATNPILVHFSADVYEELLCAPDGTIAPSGSPLCSAPDGITLFENGGEALPIALQSYGPAPDGGYVAEIVLQSGTLDPNTTYTLEVAASRRNQDSNPGFECDPETSFANCQAGALPVSAEVPELPATFLSQFTTRLDNRILRFAPDENTCPSGTEPPDPAALNSDVQIVFTEDVDCSSITTGEGGSLEVSYEDTYGITRFLDGSVTCDAGDGDPQPGDQSASFNSNRVTFTPTPRGLDCLDGQRQWPVQGRLEVTMTPGILRPDGSAVLESDTTQSFCTGSPMEFVSAGYDNDLVASPPGESVQQAESVPVNSRLSLTFDRPVDVATAFADGTATASVLVELLGTDRANPDNNLPKCTAGHLETVDVNGHPDNPNTLIIAPPDDFYCYGADYRVVARAGSAAGDPPGVVSQAGIPMGFDAEVHFSTDTGVIETYLDQHCGTGASLNQNSNVEIRFSKPLLPSSVSAASIYLEDQQSSPPQALGALPVLSGGERVVTLIPGPELPPRKLYLMANRTVQDWRGNPLPHRPIRCPLDDANGNPLPGPEPGITVGLVPGGGNSNPSGLGWAVAFPPASGNSGSVRPEVAFGTGNPPNGVLQQSLSCTSIQLRNGDGANVCQRIDFVPGDCTDNDASTGCYAVVVPNGMLAPGSYTLRVGLDEEIVDMNLIAASGGSQTFAVDDNTSDTISPTITPADGAEDVPVTLDAIELDFGFDLLPSSVPQALSPSSSGNESIVVAYADSGDPIAGTFALEPSGDTNCNSGRPCIADRVRFMPEAPLSAEPSIEVTISNNGSDCSTATVLCDAAGNPIANRMTATFSTNDQAITVDATAIVATADNGDGTISRQSGFEIAFQSDGQSTLIDPLDPRSLRAATASSADNIQVTYEDQSGGEQHVPGCVDVGLDGRAVLFAPRDPLPANATLTVKVGRGDACGTQGAAIEDVAGNAMSTCVTQTFTTAQ